MDIKINRLLGEKVFSKHFLFKSCLWAYWTQILKRLDLHTGGIKYSPKQAPSKTAVAFLLLQRFLLTFGGKCRA